MIDQATQPVVEQVDREAADAALERHFRELRLEHARLGRPICEGRDGKVVWLSPEEVFAEYGLDANGKPLPGRPAGRDRPA